MEKIEMNCPYTGSKEPDLQNDFIAYLLDVFGKQDKRNLAKNEVVFLVRHCTECNLETTIEITEEGKITGCPVLPKIQNIPFKPGRSSYIKEEVGKKKDFIANLLAKEFNFQLIKKEIKDPGETPALEKLFPHLKKLNQIKKEQSS